MDRDTEDKIVQLQVCIDDGHSFSADEEAYKYDGNLPLVCSMCGYTKYVELTKEQAKKYEKLEGNMDEFLEEIVRETIPKE